MPTLDNLSKGRAEIMAGRGSFIESFPLFGYDLNDYDALFTEKLQLLMALNEDERIDWPGSTHTPADRRPRRLSAAGTATAADLDRRRRHAAVRGRAPARSACRWRWRSSAASPRASRRCSSSTARRPARPAMTPLRLADLASTSTASSPRPPSRPADVFYPAQAEVMNRIGRERGWPPTTRAQFDAARGPRGAQFVGSPAEVTDKILAAHEVFGFERFLIQMAIGVLDHAELMKAIELIGTEVAPAVRKAAGASGASAATAPGA